MHDPLSVNVEKQIKKPHKNQTSITIIKEHREGIQQKAQKANTDKLTKDKGSAANTQGKYDDNEGLVTAG